METKKIELIDEEIYHDNIHGLEVFFLPKKNFNKSFGIITVKYGAGDIEYKSELGAAHFLEHQLFEGESSDIHDRFLELGSEINAYTTYSHTSYYFNGVKNIIQNLKLLLKYIFNASFTEESVEKEKDIIIQEIKMYEDNIDFRVYQNMLKGMYGDSTISYDTAGSVESVRNITKNMLYKYYNNFYVPQNMKLIVVGDEEWGNIKKVLLSEIPIYNTLKSISLNKIKISDRINKKNICEDIGISVPKFNLGIRDDVCIKSGNAKLRKKIIMDIICSIFFRDGSKLYEEIYNQGIINDTFNCEHYEENDYSYFLISGDSNYPEKVKNSVLNKLCCNGDFYSELNLCKKEMIGTFISIFDSVESIGNILNNYYINDMDFFNCFKILEDIQIGEIKEHIKNVFIESNSVLSILN